MFLWLSSYKNKRYKTLHFLFIAVSLLMRLTTLYLVSSKITTFDDFTALALLWPFNYRFNFLMNGYAPMRIMQYFLLLTNLVIVFVHWVSTGVLYEPRYFHCFGTIFPNLNFVFVSTCATRPVHIQSDQYRSCSTVKQRRALFIPMGNNQKQRCGSELTKWHGI